MPDSSLQTFADDLAAISGPEHLRVDENTFSIAPASTEEVAAMLRYANKNSIAVAPYGGGTKQGWGNPIHPSLNLHMHRIDAVREHTWQDMTCTVQAGCTWSSMQSSLAKHGQFVALDPLWPDRATIGGIAATNDSGSLRLRYGSLRDLIIGMTIVLADGTIARTGGKVVKNVAGYDLHKLMIGALGTLGIITEITFRLHSIPQTRAELYYSCTRRRNAWPASHQNSRTPNSVLNLSNSAPTVKDSVSMCVWPRVPEVIHDQASSLTKLAQSANLAVSGSGPNVWNARQEHFDRREHFVVKATMLPSDIPQFADNVPCPGRNISHAGHGHHDRRYSRRTPANSSPFGRNSRLAAVLLRSSIIPQCNLCLVQRTVRYASADARAQASLRSQPYPEPWPLRWRNLEMEHLTQLEPPSPRTSIPIIRPTPR